jgi:hypothetical protein
MKLTVAFLLALSTAAYGGQILTNGDFETGSLSPWTNDTRFAPGAWSITNTNCFAGNFCATAPGNIGLEQTFAGVATADISSVTFKLLHSNTVGTAAAYDFFYTGGIDDEFAVFTSGTGWNSFDVTSQLRSNATLIGFEVFGDGASTTMADNLSIVASPEPRTWALLLSGLVGLGILQRKRSRSVS